MRKYSGRDNTGVLPEPDNPAQVQRRKPPAPYEFMNTDIFGLCLPGRQNSGMIGIPATGNNPDSFEKPEHNRFNFVFKNLPILPA